MSESAYGPRLDEALALMADRFRSVYRKTTTVPYLTHLLAVCALVGEYGGDEDQMIAAVLHDYLEDIPGATEDEVRARFGDRVARLVVALTDTTVQPKPPWKPRKESYLAMLRHEPPELKLISAADKLHNCRSTLRDHRQMGNAVFDRFRASREDSLWYYRSVVEALGHGWDHPILEELRDAVNDLHRAAEEPL